MTIPALAITMGDPAGVGPEIITKGLNREEIRGRFRPLIIGSERALVRAFSYTGTHFSYTKINPDMKEIGSWEGIALLSDESRLGEEIPVGQIDPTCGASAFIWLDRAIRLALEKRVIGIVTAPLHKEALNQAGYHYAGHTEILAEKTGTEEYCLMLSAGNFRVAHVTCHVPLSKVSDLLTQERIVTAIRLFDEALTRMDGKRPRIAVCAFNPHSGEGGLFGVEESRAIRPAVKQSQEQGIQAEGPFPCDSIFPQHVGGRFDGVIAMYHDQGHIAFKLNNFQFDPKTQEWSEVTGVNTTLGLPIVRTSVDHGTAFDLAGTGKASERSLLDAIKAAVQLGGLDA